MTLTEIKEKKIEAEVKICDIIHELEGLGISVSDIKLSVERYTNVRQESFITNNVKIIATI